MEFEKNQLPPDYATALLNLQGQINKLSDLLEAQISEHSGKLDDHIGVSWPVFERVDAWFAKFETAYEPILTDIIHRERASRDLRARLSKYAVKGAAGMALCTFALVFIAAVIAVGHEVSSMLHAAIPRGK
tara:strand:- start:742 stop:1134 length:393 start_codon:yes stop_codon:yes gene_type:complete